MVTNFTEISQHLVKQTRVYKIQTENGQGQNKQLYSIDMLFCFYEEGNVSGKQIPLPYEKILYIK